MTVQRVEVPLGVSPVGVRRVEVSLGIFRMIFTAAPTFVGQEAMGPILFDQSRLENNGGGKDQRATP